MVRPEGVKSSDLLCPCLEFLRPGFGTFNLPPGETFTLSFEEVSGHFLRLEINPREENPASGAQAIDIDALKQPRSLLWRGDGWRLVDAPLGLTDSGAQIWWQGARVLSSATAADSDPELKKQLRALGYL
jgi:hypothetical protein